MLGKEMAVEGVELLRVVGSAQKTFLGSRVFEEHGLNPRPEGSLSRK